MKPWEKTILIKTSGSPRIGMGHVYRSLGLAKQLRSDLEVLFHTNAVPEVQVLVQEQSVRYFVDEIETSVVEREKVDLLLFDQLGDDNGLFQALKTRFPYLKIVALDYFNYDNEFADAIINLFNHNPDKPRPDKNSVQYYEGLEYAIIREEFETRISQTKEIPQKVSKVLVTFGGVDSKGNTRMALQLLEMAGAPDVKVEAILGPLWRGELPEVTAPNIYVHHSVPSSSMVNFMVEADLAFCGAGTTMLELLSLGTPTIVLPQNHLEEKFALSVEQKGAVRVIKGVPQQQDADYIRNLLNSPSERKVLSRRSKSLVDGRGTKRIHHIVSHMLGKEDRT
jgi:spore coat polysaccharide biosynthesis predicted glycosyltransferase SpsG